MFFTPKGPYDPHLMEQQKEEGRQRGRREETGKEEGGEAAYEVVYFQEQKQCFQNCKTLER